LRAVLEFVFRLFVYFRLSIYIIDMLHLEGEHYNDRSFLLEVPGLVG
jgi:hypothetical protein